MTAETQRPELTHWVSRLSKAKIAVVGDLVLDEYVFGHSDRISREAPVPVVRERRREQVLGGAANVVANLRALGVGCSVVGVVGRDDAGAQLRALLKERGARLSGLVRDRERPTEIKTRILAGGVSTTPQQVLRLDRGGGGAPLGAAAVAALREAVVAAAERADVLVVSDYGLGVLAPGVVAAARRCVRMLPVIVDSRFDLGEWRGVTGVKPNLPELSAVTGRRVRDARSVAQAARALARAQGLDWVLVTRGHRGLTFQPAEGKGMHLPVHGAAEAVDVTGAGDTVLATFAAALAAGAAEVDAARLANIAAGLVVQQPGTTPVDPAALARAAEQA